MMLPLMSGHIGRPGTNTGCWGGSIEYPVASFAIPNPVKPRSQHLCGLKRLLVVKS